MKAPLRVNARATADAKRIANSLREGERFLLAPEAALISIETLPEGGPLVRGTDVRRVVVPPPFDAYLVFYRLGAAVTRVLRVIDGRRHPETWEQR